jgi:tRNA (guanine-N7-)-methyltransferase
MFPVQSGGCSISAGTTFFNMLQLVPELQVTRLDLVELFGRHARLHVDIGCGDGSLLCELAEQFPEKNFLGIERLTKRVEKVRRKGLKIENVRVLRTDALFAVRYLLPENSVETFYLFFPDPWPKRRHQQRRIFTCEFLNSIAASLEQNGALRIATDELNYFHQMEQFSRSHSQLEIVPSSRNDCVLPRTKFESRFQQQGVPIYRLTLRKISPVE